LKAIFITSLVSSLTSLAAIFALSAMTIVPRVWAESRRSYLMLVTGAFFVAWLSLAFWARPRASTVSIPRWLRGLLIFTGIVYVLGVLFCVAG
jgi:signal transduction histidine kinase